MKQIIAIIQPFELRKVMESLHELQHFPGISISDVRGQGRGRGVGGKFKVTEDGIDYQTKVRLDIFCSDSQCDEIVLRIQKNSRTGHQGDGIVAVGDLERVIRIRSGEAKDDAV